jgi:ectoine hydroxylase-related dioxygenase (phytanoyl-CoA dioxygenase family)
MPTLTRDQIDFYRHNGFLMVENAVSADQLAALQRDFADWVTESRQHIAAYGEMIDLRPRFDLEPGHSAARPALRRVNSPQEVSDAYFEVMAASRMTDIVADLIGPNVKHHHCKINSKLPGAATAVKWHQDFPFTPHTNDDLVTALLMVDEVTAENGPLDVLPGSHVGPIHSLWHDGRFTGAIDDATAAASQAASFRCLGSAGTVCLMHTRLLHGSAPNRSPLPRTLYICVYSAEDALPLCDSPVPSRFEGMVVRGKATGTVRATPFQLRLPQKPKSASFFVQQAGFEQQAGDDAAAMVRAH